MDNEAELLQEHLSTLNAFVAAQNESTRLAGLLRDQAKRLHAARHAPPRPSSALSVATAMTKLFVMFDAPTVPMPQQAGLVQAVIERLRRAGAPADIRVIKELPEPPPSFVIYFVATPTGRMEDYYEAATVARLRARLGADPLGVRIQRLRYGTNPEAFAYDSEAIVYYLDTQAKYHILETAGLNNVMSRLLHVQSL